MLPSRYTYYAKGKEHIQIVAHWMAEFVSVYHSYILGQDSHCKYCQQVIEWKLISTKYAMIQSSISSSDE